MVASHQQNSEITFDEVIANERKHSQEQAQFPGGMLHPSL